MTQSVPPDLSKLRIDRSLAPVVTRRRRRWLWWGGILLVLAAAGGWFALQPRAVTVQTTSVVTTYPSQQFVLLNATGYVVAQRKAAISSKATGRLEWLGVAEGSRVKAGDIIARIDARDVVAQGEGAQASVKAARAALEQALAEERDAVAQLKRNQDLLAKGFVSAAAVDTAKARAEKATAGVANARATINVTRSDVAQCAGRRRLHGDPRAVRRRDPVQERQRGRSRHAVLQRGRLQGRRRVDGRHEHARSRGRRRRVQPVQGQPWASPRKSCSTRFRTRASAAASAASCRRWTAPRPPS